jgi:hypothetical protein
MIGPTERATDDAVRRSPGHVHTDDIPQRRGQAGDPGAA